MTKVKVNKKKQQQYFNILLSQAQISSIEIYHNKEKVKKMLMIFVKGKEKTTAYNV
jgi:hypothetical protein